jgi:hypothetical protein
MRARPAAILSILFSSGALALSLACSSPAAPSASPSVGGAWLANSTLASVNGGDCVGTLLQSAAGSRDVFLTALKQTGSLLNATVTSQGNGTSCAYSGSSNGGAVRLSLSTCQTSRVPGVRCANGAMRDLQLVGETLTANVNTAVGTGTGTDASTWSVLVPGSASPVGTLSLSANFTWTFLGLPSSDYHTFTGTVFPGYEDGTISIPADPNPFCAKCGWFSP